MINWKQVSELREEIGDNAFDEVVELFLEEVDLVLARLRSDPNPALFEEDLHFLKGCAMNLGFSDLTRVCLAGEMTAARGTPEKVDLQPVFDCYDSSRVQFLEGVAAGLAA